MCIGNATDTAAWLAGVPAWDSQIQRHWQGLFEVTKRTFHRERERAACHFWTCTFVRKYRRFSSASVSTHDRHICRRIRGDNAALLPRLGNCFRLCRVAATFQCAKRY